MRRNDRAGELQDPNDKRLAGYIRIAVQDIDVTGWEPEGNDPGVARSSLRLEAHDVGCRGGRRVRLATSRRSVRLLSPAGAHEQNGDRQVAVTQLIVHINMTPMIDVLLVLLVVFMISVQFRSILSVNVPPSVAHRTPGPTEPQLLLEQQDGSYAVNGAPNRRGGEGQTGQQREMHDPHGSFHGLKLRQLQSVRLMVSTCSVARVHRSSSASRSRFRVSSCAPSRRAVVAPSGRV